MIVSSCFNHVNKEFIPEHFILIACNYFKKLYHLINSINGRFGQVTSECHGSDCTSCHLSIRCPQKRHIDIYQLTPDCMTALINPLEKAATLLSKLALKTSTRYRSFQSGEIGQ